MFEEGITINEILGSKGKANAFIVAHTMWGIASFVSGLIMLLYMKYASNRAVALWLGVHSMVIFVYCGFRVMSSWHAYHDAMLFIALILGMISVGSMFLMLLIVRNVRNMETIDSLQKKIKFLQELHNETLRKENDPPV